MAFPGDHNVQVAARPGRAGGGGGIPAGRAGEASAAARPGMVVFPAPIT